MTQGWLAILSALMLLPDAVAEPLMSIADAEVALDGSGTPTVTIDVQLSEPASQSVQVSYTTIDGTALEGTHYVMTSDTLVIPANQSNGTITVPLLGLDFGPVTTFSIKLSGATNATIADDTASVTIHPRSPSFSVGDTVPGAAPGTTFASFGTPSINSSGKIAFLTTTSLGALKKQAIFVEDGIVASQGDSAPGITRATFISFKDPAINSNDSVAFIARLGGAVRPANNLALFTNEGGAMVPVIRTGDPAPGIPGYVLTQFHAFSLTNSAVFFTCYLCNHRVTPQVHYYSLCVWTPGGGLRLLMRERQQYLGKTVTRIDTLIPTSTSIGYGRSARGNNVTARLTLANGANAVVVFDANGNSEVVAETADTAPDTSGAKFTVFGRPVMNSIGGAAVQGFLAGFTTTGNAGLFTDTGSMFGRAYGVADPVPGLGGLSISASDAPHYNSQKDVASLITLAGTGATRTNNKAILLKADTAAPVVLARTGDTPPGVPSGAVWKSFKSVGLPDDRGPIFLATLAPGPGGVTLANDLGLWAADATGTVRLIVRENDNITVDGTPKTVRTFSALGIVAGSPDQSRSFSENGYITFLATFTDRTKSIIRAQIP